MAVATAVVLDSNRIQRDDIRIRLSRCGVLPICFQDEWICLENIHAIKPAFGVLRPDSRETAIRFINIARAIQNTFPIIVLSNQNEIENFVHNNRLLNLFFLRYPVDDQEFQVALGLLADSKPNVDYPVFISGSPESQKRLEWLSLLSVSKEPVLIQGEPGVGKRLMAKVIHSCSMAENLELEFINARDISGQWIRQTRKRMDAPLGNHVGNHGKALFYTIENIEALPSDLQSQMLLIVEKPFENVGINASRRSVRFITLAETDLEYLSREGRFRKDLYYRLSVLKMTVPPLRDRQDDVHALSDFFAAKYSIRNRGAIFRLPDEVRTVFKNYDWPGNVAELKHTIKRSLSAEVPAWTENLSIWCKHHKGMNKCNSSASTIDANDDVRRFLKNNHDMPLKQARQRYAMQVEIRIMKTALSKTNGNCKKAAGLLNISYKSMLNKAKAYQLV